MNMSESFHEEHAREITPNLGKEFTRELEIPYQKSFLKKLRRVAAAFALAGASVIAESSRAVAPELSDDFLTVKKIAKIDWRETEKRDELLRPILESLRARGGVLISPQLEEIYKDKTLSHQTRQEFGKKFSRPETVFGKEYMEQNPDHAKEEWKHLEKALQSSVYIVSEINEEKWTVGSGVVIETKKGKAILTVAHNLDNAKTLTVQFSFGAVARGIIEYIDEKTDLALLHLEDVRPKRQNAPSLTAREENTLVFLQTGVPSLAIDEHTVSEHTKLASIGNPYNFPFEIFLNKYVGITKTEEGLRLVEKADPRFSKLALYGGDIQQERHNTKYVGRPFFEKGEAMPGMSGGPVITYDKEPQVVALVAEMAPFRSDQSEVISPLDQKITPSNAIYTHAIPASVLLEFIDKYEKDVKSSQKPKQPKKVSRK